MSYKTKGIENITDSRTFKRIWLRSKLDCDRCPPNKGCNRKHKKLDNKNWKKYRKKQWKQMK